MVAYEKWSLGESWLYQAFLICYLSAEGNIHGYEQEHGILGDISGDYMNAPLQNGRPVEFYVKESSKTNGKDLLLQHIPAHLLE